MINLIYLFIKFKNKLLNLRAYFFIEMIFGFY